MIVSIVRRVFGISVLFIILCLFVFAPHARPYFDGLHMGGFTAEIVMLSAVTMWLLGSILYGVALLSGKPLKKFSLAMLLLQLFIIAFGAAMGYGQGQSSTPELVWAIALLIIVPAAALFDLLAPPWRFDNILVS